MREIAGSRQEQVFALPCPTTIRAFRKEEPKSLVKKKKFTYFPNQSLQPKRSFLYDKKNSEFFPGPSEDRGY